MPQPECVSGRDKAVINPHAAVKPITGLTYIYCLHTIC